MRLTVAIAAVIAASLAACGGGSSGHTITGSINVLCDSPAFCQAAQGLEHSNQCDTGVISSGYSDISSGAQVTVKDGKGTVIATSRLDTGLWTSTACRFAFKVPNVPDSSFYSIEVGHRGAQTYSASDLSGRKFNVDLSLGG